MVIDNQPPAPPHETHTPQNIVNHYYIDNHRNTNIFLADGRQIKIPCMGNNAATINYYYMDKDGNIHIDFNNHPSIVIPRKPIEVTHINHNYYDHNFNYN
ncbi:hypothetical protein EDM29_14310 [Staphylococcus aureus]|nr:hypothetical protein EDM29_14310 [Staphylococcus aureus]